MSLFFWLLLLGTPCEDSLSHLTVQLREHPTEVQNQFQTLSTNNQTELLSLFKLSPKQLESLDKEFWRGFFYIQTKINAYHDRSDFLREEHPEAFEGEAPSTSKQRRLHTLSRLHSAVLIPLAKSIGLLLSVALDSKKDFSLENLDYAFDGILQTLVGDREITYTNGFMGLIEEFRAAAYLVRQGYELLEMRYDYQYHPSDENRRSEIDLVLRDKKDYSKVILVEIKQSLTNSSAHRAQYQRYEDLKNGEIEFHYDVSESWIMIMRKPPSMKEGSKFTKTHPDIRMIILPKKFRTQAIYPGIKFKSSKT